MTRSCSIQCIQSCKSLYEAKEIYLNLKKDHPLAEDSFLSNKLIEMFGKCGSPQEARQVFDAIVHKDPFSWAFMFRAYAQNSHLKHAREIFDKMTQKDALAWTSMLLAYARTGHILKAKQTFDEMPQHNLLSWNAVLSVHAHRWDLKDAEGIFSRMPEYDLVSWNSMLAAYSRNGHVEAAKRIFDSMEARDLVSWTTVLVALSQGGDLRGAKILFDSMPQHDLVAWTAMLGAYALHEDVDSAQRIFREMPEMDLVSCNTAMRCCRDVRQSKEIFDSMPQRALSTWTTMLAVLAKKSPGDESRSFFYQMPELDLTSCTIMLLSEPSNLELVKATFDQMPQRDLCSWNSVLSVYAQFGHCDYSLELFSKMPEMDMVSWNTVLNAFCLARKLHEAALLFYGMLERNVVTWDALISAFAREGHLLRARKLFDGAPDRDQILWSSMIASYAQVSTTASEAFHLFNEMQAVDSPNASCFASILAASSHKGGFQTGKSFFASMVVDHAIEPTRQHYSCMVDLLSRAGHLCDARDLITSMPFFPSALEWTCLLGACKSHKDYSNLRLGDDVVRSVIDANEAAPKTPYALLANVYTSQTSSSQYL